MSKINDSRWLSDCKTQEQKDQREKEFASYRSAFKALSEMLDKHFTKKDSVRDYSDPNWQARQISVNEFNEVVKQIKNFIKEKD